jgi:SulP family sulfate permease
MLRRHLTPQAEPSTFGSSVKKLFSAAGVTSMNPRYQFNRLELAGSLGDLGTLLPIAIGMIVINGLNPSGLLFAIGLYYILSGVYYGVTVPVQPMKVIGAYAIAAAMTANQIVASGVLIGLFLFVIGATGAITLIGRYTPKVSGRTKSIY